MYDVNIIMSDVDFVKYNDSSFSRHFPFLLSP